MSTLPAYIAGAITRFDNAAQSYAFIGAADPEDRSAIQHQYDTARERLERAITKAISK